VTHITLSKKTNLKPSLEFYSDGCGEPRRVTIEQFPFRIGRAETASLRVDSAEVSREHAEIFERNGIWLVRDLGSTNGTQVNGKPIKETLLNDGDILKVAETELTFIASAASQFQRMVTQPVPSKRARSAPSALPQEVAATRMLTEATLWQAIPVHLFAARSLRHDVIEAHFVLSASNEHQRLFAEQACVVGERYREIERMRAVELAAEWSDSSRLFFNVVADESISPHRLLSNLKLQAVLPDGWELGVTLSLPTDVDILRISEIYREARSHSLSVAFDQFQGNGAQVMHLESFPPDYLVLAASMTKDLTATRQPMRRLESVLAACNELAIKPILPPQVGHEALSLCQEVGFDFVLQPPTHRAAKPVAALSASL
jgi:EAL domain-containing protein (putative c-di-GMP-specific phosphodiesterase class I)